MGYALQSPVFILGLGRSGTTLLYQMLAASGCFNIITARHVICFDELADGRANREHSARRLGERFARLGLSTRRGEVVQLGPQTPEEYGFILDNLHAGPGITRRNFSVFLRICEVVQRDSGTYRPLLLKNPWDFRNGSLIKTLIPDAKIVYIHRNPFHVLGSMYRLIRTAATQPSEYLAMLSDHYEGFIRSDFLTRVADALCDRCPGLMARAIIRHAHSATSGFLRDLGQIPPEDRIDIRYEALCTEPDKTITAILDRFGFEGGTVDYAGMIGARASHIGREIAAQRALVIGTLSDYAAAVGYDLPSLADESA